MTKAGAKHKNDDNDVEKNDDDDEGLKGHTHFKGLAYLQHFLCAATLFPPTSSSSHPRDELYIMFLFLTTKACLKLQKRALS